MNKKQILAELRKEKAAVQKNASAQIKRIDQTIRRITKSTAFVLGASYGLLEQRNKTSKTGGRKMGQTTKRKRTQRKRGK
jgi:hypothetical protein